MDVVFRFEKEGYETVTKTVTVHEKGQMSPIFPTRVWFDSAFTVTVQDSEGMPLEGVAVSMDDVSLSDTDHNGKIVVTIPKP